MTILLVSANLLCLSILMNVVAALAKTNGAAALESATSLLFGAALLIGGAILRRRLRRDQSHVIPISEARFRTDGSSEPRGQDAVTIENMS
jgi:hypothetical protein